jgi:hypothetical protein
MKRKNVTQMADGLKSHFLVDFAQGISVEWMISVLPKKLLPNDVLDSKSLALNTF